MPAVTAGVAMNDELQLALQTLAAAVILAAAAYIRRILTMPAPRRFRDRKRRDPAASQGVNYGCVYRAAHTAGEPTKLDVYTTRPVDVVGEITQWVCNGESVTAQERLGPQSWRLTFGGDVSAATEFTGGSDPNVMYPPGVVQTAAYIVIDV